MRLNKYIAAAGVCSRREADRLIEDGRVTVDGVRAGIGIQVEGTEEILIDGEKLRNPSDKKRVVIACYKETGTVCSTVNQGREQNNIVDKINYHERIFPIGRLDKDSEGLILLTNDGELVNRLLKSRYGKEKEYEVTLDRDIPDSVLREMEKGGLPLLPNRKSRECRIKRIDNRCFTCILTEGMNREIRRMAEYFGFDVVKLKRLRFGSVTLTGLMPGKWRILSDAEVSKLVYKEA